MTDLQRYARIDTVLPREFLLLQGKGCRWRRCTFCDYYTDVGPEPYLVNRSVLGRVTGVHGVLDVINSGSAPELDARTLWLIRETAERREIHTLWFEAHWMYHHRLAAFAERFPNQTVKFRCGVESFDPALREKWNKGIPPEVTPEEIARYYQGVCLLVGLEGQTKEGILRDLALAEEHFEYFSVNQFVENSTGLRRDPELSRWFAAKVAPRLARVFGAEVLLNNTDLGVG